LFQFVVSDDDVGFTFEKWRGGGMQWDEGAGRRPLAAEILLRN
jgi:hypothetical protein